MNYALLLKQLEQILEPETYIISRMANTSAFLYQHMPELNWVGFYLVKDGYSKSVPSKVKLPVLILALVKEYVVILGKRAQRPS